jgi:Protein of unknown function (DUF2889)
MDARTDRPIGVGNPSRTTPERVPGSIRRTSNIDMTFDPDDRTTMWLRCRARDLLTDLDGAPHVLGETSLEVRTGPNRVVEAISADPPRPTLEHLVGHRGGAGFRKQIDIAAPGDRAAGSLLYYLLDDIPPATLISGYVWSRFGEEDRPRIPVVPPGETVTPHLPARGPMENICSGWRTGGTATSLLGSGQRPIGSTVEAPDLERPGDPLSWHRLDDLPPSSMRRRRRVDVVLGQPVTIDAMFRDSCQTPDDVEVVVHEYAITSAVDSASATLVAIDAEPRVLPFPECLSAADAAPRLVGARIADLRTTVLTTLTGIECCTHLNDALRAMAEVPVLLDALALPR